MEKTIYKTFEFSSLLYGKEYKVKLDFRDTKAVIVGDSATGKSLLYQLIEKKANSGDLDAVCYNAKAISILKRELKTGNFQFTEKLVVLDNADVLLKKVPQLANQINLNSSNIYLIFARKAIGVDASPNVCGTLNYQHGTFVIKYLYPEGMWP